MSDSSDEEVCLTPTELTETVNNAQMSFLPQQSREKYLKQYDMFNTWRLAKGAKTFSENVLLAYFIELSENKKASTLWIKDLCSHDRSWHFFVEAIGAPTAFPAGFAEDYDSWFGNGGQTKQTIYLGDLTNTRARGNFYLSTNAKPTYAKGPEGLKPEKSQTRERRNSTLTKLLTYLR